MQRAKALTWKQLTSSSPLQVHLREEVTKEQDIQKLGRAISEELVTLGEEVKASGTELEASLAQLDQYQTTIASLRQSILACEGELRTVSSPAYTAKDRDKALAEQSVRTITSIVTDLSTTGEQRN